MVRSQGLGEKSFTRLVPASLRSGEVADRAGVNVETLRYYERRGLLPVPPRTASGYRCYPESAVERVRHVKILQQLGFSLTEVLSLFDVRVDAPVTCGDLARLAQDKLASIEAKLTALQQIRDALLEVSRSCCAPTHDPRSCARLQPNRSKSEDGEAGWGT